MTKSMKWNLVFWILVALMVIVVSMIILVTGDWIQDVSYSFFLKR